MSVTLAVMHSGANVCVHMKPNCSWGFKVILMITGQGTEADGVIGHQREAWNVSDPARRCPEGPRTERGTILWEVAPPA